MLDYLSANPWWVWVGLVLLFGLIELFTLELTAATLAVSSLVGLLVSFTRTDFWVGVVAAVLAAMALLLFVRPPLLAALRRRSGEAVTNVAALVGLAGTISAAAAGSRPALVRLDNGETWTVAVQEDATAGPFVAGEQVVVAAIQGASVVVVRR